MPKFRVRVQRELSHTAIYEVEADSVEDAVERCWGGDFDRGADFPVDVVDEYVDETRWQDVTTEDVEEVK